MRDFLLDTNHFRPALQPGSGVRDRILKTLRSGSRVGTCIPVLCEFEIGIQQTRNPDASRKALSRLLASLRLWPLDREVARLYGSIFLTLRSRGRVLSQVDMMAAALALRMNLTLVSSDGDFDALPEIRRENWLDS